MHIELPKIYNTLAHQEHLLIAGTTGSGKSTVIHGVIAAALCGGGDLVAIDPKGCELSRYNNIAVGYADSPKGIEKLISDCVGEMDYRFKRLNAESFAPLHIIIDEYAAIKYRCKNKTIDDLCDIAFKGRAAGLHLIIATQRPTRDIIGGMISANMTAKLALRTVSAQESRNIIGVPGAEALPRYGQGILITPDLLRPQRVLLPMIDTSTQDKITDYIIA